MIINYF